MLAGIAAALAAGLDAPLAAEFGTLVAGVTVQKLFVTGTATPSEILAISRNPTYRYRPELAAQPEKARYYPETRIEIASKLPDHRSFTHVIFDHDGTISTLRQGWAQLMESMMIQAILGRSRETIDDEVLGQIEARVKEFISATAGVQTLVQMKGLSEMVREFGYVEVEKVLDEKGYKEIFNRNLMRRVEERFRQLEAGRLDVEDLTIRNSVPFLKALHSRGVRLYLSSGTDQEDVEREAEILGYAELFTGGIYGAVGDIGHEPKKKVIELVLREIEQTTCEQVVTFGDGPVEIRETRAHGGFTVGVASDEMQRSGLNLIKRARLIQAGADLIIPDFSEKGPLMRLIFQE